MGLLNRRLRPFDFDQAFNAVLQQMKPPYPLQEFFLLVLTQISEWIPAEGYYAYAADADEHQLTLRVTRTATGIAMVAPNYAGLVLGTAIRPVPFEMASPNDPWAFEMGPDGSFTVGFGPKALIRVAADMKTRISESDRMQLLSWLHRLEPVMNLVSYATYYQAETLMQRPDIRRQRADLLLKIPQVIGLLAGLGADVLHSTDGYLATWVDMSDVKLSWEMGQGSMLSQQIRPQDLYQIAREYTYAVWDGSQLPETIKNMGFKGMVVFSLNAADGVAGVLCYATTEVIRQSASLSQSLEHLVSSLENSLQSRRAARIMAENYLGALLAAASLLDEADPYNKNHHRQVSQLAVRLAMRAGWDAERIRWLEMAGRLHDVGMVTVALELTNQRGNLAEQSREIIQQHPVVGADLLAGLPDDVLPDIVVRAIREHHERWDGQGYPDGLTGDALSLEGRMVACAEQFVARISNRSYRQGLKVERALYDVQHLAGRQLDPEVVDLLLAVYKDAGAYPMIPD